MKIHWKWEHHWKTAIRKSTITKNTAAHGLIGSSVKYFFDLELDDFLLVLFFHNLVRVPPLRTELLSEVIPNEIYQHLFVLVRLWYHLSETELSLPLIFQCARIIFLLCIQTHQFNRLPGQLWQGVRLTAHQRLFIKQFFCLQLCHHLGLTCECLVRLYLPEPFVLFGQSHQRVSIVFVFMLLAAFFLKFHVLQDLCLPTLWFVGWSLWGLLWFVPIGLI